MAQAVAGIVMAAGKGTRMKSALPKAAHPVCGKPMTRHVIDAARAAGVGEMFVVVGHEADVVKSAIGEDVLYALQAEQLGTGHACAQAVPMVPESCSHVLVLPGDAPLVRPETLRRLLDEHIRAGNAATLLTAVLEDAVHYGRVLRSAEGAVLRVLEARDAGPEELAIREINTSIYCFEKQALTRSLSQVRSDNAQGEYYLTDTVGILSASGARVGAVIADDYTETLGINNRVELAEASAAMRRRIAEELMLSGVSIVDPATTYIECDVSIGRDSMVYPFTLIECGCRIGSDCEIGPFARLRDAVIPDGTKEVRGYE